MFPYIFEVYENITVSPNDRLTMQAGELIHFHDGSGVFVDGDLRMEGDEGQVVRLVPGTFPVVERFLGVVFREGSTGHLEHCEFLDSRKGVHIIGSSPTISNCGFFQSGRGISIENGASPQVHDSIFLGLEEWAIVIKDSDPLIKNNTIQGNAKGMWITNNSSPNIESNEITENYGWAIELTNSVGAVIRNNTIRYNNQYAIITHNVSQITAEGNNLSANGWLGGTEWYHNIWAKNASFVMRNNTISDAYFGLLLMNSPFVLENNLLRNHTAAVVGHDGSSIAIRNNVFEGGRVDTDIVTATIIENNTFYNSTLSLGPTLFSNNTVERGSVWLYMNSTLSHNIVNDGTHGIVVTGDGRDVEAHISDTTILNCEEDGLEVRDSSRVSFVNSTIQNSGLNDIYLIESEIVAINSSFGEEKRIANGDLIVKNFLHVSVLDKNGNPLEGASVRVWDGSDLSYDVRTDFQGQADWLLVTDRVYSSSENAVENDTYLDVISEGHYFSGLPQLVDMSTSHREVVTEDQTTPPPPTVQSIDPSNGATDVHINSTITITFSTRMNKASVQDSMTVTGAEISTYTWNLEGTVLTINFTSNLEYGTTYEIVLGDEAKDLAGEHITSLFESSFTTEDQPIGVDMLTDFLGEFWWLVLALAVFVPVIVVGSVLFARRRKREELPPPPFDEEIPPPPDEEVPPPPEELELPPPPPE
jgi:parallel beta-helix repeat protein